MRSFFSKELFAKKSTRVHKNFNSRCLKSKIYCNQDCSGKSLWLIMMIYAKVLFKARCLQYFVRWHIFAIEEFVREPHFIEEKIEANTRNVYFGTFYCSFYWDMSEINFCFDIVVTTTGFLN